MKIINPNVSKVAVSKVLKKETKVGNKVEKAQKIEPKYQQVSSSNLAGIKYHRERRELDITFKQGLVYRYFDVSPTLYKGLMAAGSKGKYHARYIKNKSFKKIN